MQQHSVNNDATIRIIKSICKLRMNKIGIVDKFHIDIFYKVIQNSKNFENFEEFNNIYLNKLRD